MAVMRSILLAAFITVAADTNAARACAYIQDTGWTAAGGGTPAALMVLGGETCQGKVRGTNLQIIAPPHHGKVKIIGPSTYVYTPNRAFRGPDLMNVSAVIDGVGFVIGSIVITVE